MQTTSKFNRVLSLLLTLCMALSMINVPMARAAEEKTLYLKPNANWLQSGARFAAYFFGNGETWVSMTDEDGDGLYEVAAPEGYPNVIFCRMNPATTENNWNNKWNQTSDLTVPTDGTNCYTVADNTWDNGNGTWSAFTPTEPEVPSLYLKPNANWLQSSARFAAYFFGNGETWVSMTDEDGDGYYKVEIPEGYPNVIFCRMNPATTENNWNNKWNQTSDLTVPTDGTNCYTVADNTWDNGNGTWSTYAPTKPEQPEEPAEETYIVAGVSTLCGSNWDPADVNNKMTLNKDTGLYEKTYSARPAGAYEFKVTDGTWNNCWGNGGNNYTFTLETASDVTITFNASTKAITVIATPVEVKAPALYLKPNANWLQSGARFAAYFFGNGELWVSMTDEDGDGYYEVEIPEGYPNVIFCRMNPATTENNWNNKWNQTSDLTVPTDGTNCYTVADNTWDNGNGTWSTYAPTKPEQPEEPAEETYIVAGVSTLCGSNWDPADINNKMTLNKDTGLYEKTYSARAAGAYEFKVTDGTWNNCWGNGGNNYTFTLETNSDVTITFNASTKAITVSITKLNNDPLPAPDYYLVGYINGADYGIEGDSANLGTYKFVDGKLTASFTSASYVLVKDTRGIFYYAQTYCTDTSVTLAAGNSEKMLVPAGVELEFTLTVNDDGTLTLSYAIVVDEPEIPETWNRVVIHFLKPSNWGSMINGYIWDENGALPSYEAYNTWPGSPVPANADKAGWYDLVVATETPRSFNFIFNDSSSQTADLTTGEITGPTELWVVDGTVFTTAPREWTHYTVTLHYQKPDNWGSSINAYAWLDNGTQLMGAWPGTNVPASANNGWYNAVIYVEIGQALNVIFNDGSNQTADIQLGVMTGNTELWLSGSGTQVAKPGSWVDENRTIHLPGTLGGNNWNASGNRMEYDAVRGLYTITFKDVIPGTYEYKIAINGSWGENYGAGGEANGANMTVTVTETQDVTFWYSDSSHRVVCSVNYDINAVVLLSGTGIAANTVLTDTELDGLYSVTLQLVAGTYNDLKITCGDKEVAFHEFTLSAAKSVTFFFDPATGMGYHNGSDKKVETANIYYNTKDLNYKDPFGAVAVGETVTFSITTGTDATGVVLVVRGCESVALEKVGTPVDGVQRWSCTTQFIAIGEYQYYFAITNGSDMVFYCDDNYNDYYRKGDYGTGTVRDMNNLFPYDIVVYTADFETPDWMKDAVIYQIFPDRFFDGKEYNNDDQTTARGTVDYEYVSDWYLLPENPEMTGEADYPIYALKGDGNWSNEIYGGDLAGITERIEYLKALGVTVIYLNPVFSSISNHRYDACDYMTIDPILGDLGDFEELVAVAEANGMHIILDGVFNHVSDDSVYFDRYYKFLGKSEKIGAYPYWAYVYDLMNNEGYTLAAAETAAKAFFSENYGITDWSYTEWFAVENKKTANKDTIGLRAGEYVYSYEGWWGYDSMPVIKSTNGSEFQTGNWAEEIISHENENSVNAYWITKGMDGWRLDVANEVSDETWQHFRDSVKALDSEAVIIGEIWSDSTRYLLGDMYDSVMNYVFRDAVAGFARGYLINRDNKTVQWDSDYTAADALTTLEILRERYPEEAFYAMMNLVGSHDTSRILSYLDGVEDDRYQKDMDNAFPMYETTSERAKQLQYVVAFIQFTYAGAPTVYYGDEIGMTGGDDPDDRRAFEWGKGNRELVEWYAQLAAIRAQYPALRTGSIEPFAPDRDVMGYVRSDSGNTLIVLANRAATDKTVALEGTYVDLVTGETFTNSVTVPAYRGVILVEADEVKDYSVDSEALAPAYDPAYIVAQRSETPPAKPDPDPAPKPPVIVYPPIWGENNKGDDQDQTEIDAAEVFDDVAEDSWYYKAVNFMVNLGLMKGVGNSEFAPDEQLSRAMMWTILARLSGADSTPGDTWYENTRKWAMDAGISDGLDPNGNITREQLIVMLWRYMGEPAATENLSEFTDADSISTWAQQAMAWAVEIGLVNGVTPTTLEPKSNATRAQAATLIYRFCELVAKKD